MVETWKVTVGLAFVQPHYVKQQSLPWIVPHNLLVITSFRSYPGFEPRDPKFKQPTRRDGVLSSLNVVIKDLKLAENLSSITPARVVFSNVSFSQ